MKHKILILLLAFAVTASFLISCGDKNEGNETSNTAEDTSASVTDFLTEEESHDVPQPAEEEKGPNIVQDYIPLHEVDDHEPVSADGEGISIGFYFKTDMTLYSISFECPSWSDDVGQMTLDIYKWDADYATTVAGTPMLTETELFTDYGDNDTIEVTLPENVFVPGEYLYTFRDGKDGVGMWKSVESAEGVQSYFKGEPVSGVYKTYLYGWYED